MEIKNVQDVLDRLVADRIVLKSKIDFLSDQLKEDDNAIKKIMGDNGILKHVTVGGHKVAFNPAVDKTVFKSVYPVIKYALKMDLDMSKFVTVKVQPIKKLIGQAGIESLGAEIIDGGCRLTITPKK